jgi:8-oxo-dGTP diphosphatase
MTRPETIQVVVAALLFDEGRLLICQRAAAGPFPDKWEFPGGKIEPGEDPKKALRRELREELGISAEIGEEVWRTEHQYPGHPPIRLLFFSVQKYSGVVENRVFQQVRWAAPRDLPRVDFLEADLLLVEKLRSGEVTVASREFRESSQDSPA